MRALIPTLLVVAGVSAMAQQRSASLQLKASFLAVFRNEVIAIMDEAASQALRRPTTEEISRTIESVMKEVEASYGSLLTLSEAQAHRLLSNGPDDETNIAAMRRDIELWKKVERPMPVLLKRMQDEVAAGKIKGGLELELTRRISEFHLQQLGLLDPPPVGN